MKLIANKAMRYKTRRLQAGDEFETRHTRDARVFIIAGLAREAAEAPKPASVVEHKPEPKPEQPDIDELRAQAEDLGILVDGRWGVTRLQQMIAQAKL